MGIDSIRMIGWPTEAPILVGLSLAIAAVAWLLRRDAFAALVFGFSVLIPVFWAPLILKSVAELSLSEAASKEAPFLLAEMLIVSLLMIVCAGLSLRSLIVGRSVDRPEVLFSTLIVAHTLHLHLIYTLMYVAASIPTWAYWLGLAVRRWVL
ncbi:MAG: hypothetical protein KBA31_19575 [Alphaproteobacteria bacterium]|nr:hypothetical protein [Alphaproteobacteria bacterium]